MLTPHFGWTVEEVIAEFAQIASSHHLQYMDGHLPHRELVESMV
jgi:D-3-phosphoglycerate dehydrogenase / 2-oxoglutarate reductase